VHDPEMREQFASIMDGAIKAAADHLRACQSAGVATPGVDPRPTAFWLIWTLERGFYRLLGVPSAAVRKRRLAAVTDVIWSAYRGVARA
jgi:hypothetical protein